MPLFYPQSLLFDHSSGLSWSSIMITKSAQVRYRQIQTQTPLTSFKSSSSSTLPQYKHECTVCGWLHLVSIAHALSFISAAVEDYGYSVFKPSALQRTWLLDSMSFNFNLGLSVCLCVTHLLIRCEIIFIHFSGILTT